MHPAASVLMKIALGLQDNKEFYYEVVDAYKKAAKIYEQDENLENSSHALLSAAFVIERAGDRSQAAGLFLEAGQGYEDAVRQKRKIHPKRVVL